MSLTNVEELNDLEVALWIQDPETKEIYNSSFAYAYTNHCYPIQNLTFNEDDNILTWEAPEEGTPKSYKVFINGKLVSENSALSYSMTSSEETFTAEVIAVYDNDKTSVGVAKLFGEVEDYITVKAPRNLEATPISTSSIKLTWNATANATSYNIYRDDVLVKNTTETNYTDEGLEYNTEYCYTVTSVLDDTESEHSEKVCVKTLGEGIEETTTSLSIYPNPVDDRLYIEALTLTQTIEIYDIYGRRQQLSAISHQPSVIDVSNLNSGIYFVKISTEEGDIVKRIIKK
jgi:hypothetical protein